MKADANAVHEGQECDTTSTHVPLPVGGLHRLRDHTHDVVTTVVLVLLALVVIVAVETACMFAAFEAVHSRTSGDRISVTTQPSRTTGYDTERHAEK